MRIPSWFYSDPHFFHHNIIRYCERPYANVQEMNKDLIERFNAKVGINDDVVFVGDMFFVKQEDASVAQCLEVFHALHGKNKILVYGNHDKLAHNFPYNLVAKYLTLEIAKQDVMVSHYPYRPADRPDIHKMPEDKGNILVHGHTHRKEKTFGKMINVCCDAWDYGPVSLIEVDHLVKKMRVSR
jgi:calcineurin-like phosphoesterase family protein